LTQEEEKYYEHYFDIFSTDGWKQFVEEIKEILEAHRIEDIKDEKQLAYTKGERAAFHKVVHFEPAIRNAYDLIREREDA
jgi:thiaminase